MNDEKQFLITVRFPAWGYKDKIEYPAFGVKYVIKIP